MGIRIGLQIDNRQQNLGQVSHSDSTINVFFHQIH